MIFVFSFFTILNRALLSDFVAQIYRFPPFSRVSKRKLYFLTPTFYPLLPRFYSLTRRRRVLPPAESGTVFLFLIYIIGIRNKQISLSTRHRARLKQRYTGSIAMLHRWYSYAAPLVQGGCTFCARMLHLSGTVFSVCLHCNNPAKNEPYYMKIRFLFSVYAFNGKVFFIASLTSNPFAGFIQRKKRVFLIPRFCEDEIKS